MCYEITRIILIKGHSLSLLFLSLSLSVKQQALNYSYCKVQFYIECNNNDSISYVLTLRLSTGGAACSLAAPYTRRSGGAASRRSAKRAGARTPHGSSAAPPTAPSTERGPPTTSGTSVGEDKLLSYKLQKNRGSSIGFESHRGS